MDRDCAAADAASERRDFERARLNLARMQVSGGHALRASLAALTETAAETLRVERVGIWLYIHGRTAIRCFDLYQSSRREHSEGAVLNADDFPEYFEALEKQRAIAAIEALTDPRTRRLKNAYLDPLGVISLLDAPIFRGGQVVGVVCHEQVGAPRHWTREECDFAASVADSVALKFETAARQDAERSRRTLEEHISELHRADSIGRLAATVAHDFKNIMTVVLAGAQLIARKPGATPDILALTDQILESVERGNALATELMTFGRNQLLQTRVLDAAAAVEAMAPMLRTAVGERFPVEVRREGTAGRVLIDRAQLERVLLNLVLNARDALPNGGPITVTAGTAHIAAGTDDEGVFAVIDVADRGVGMDAATRGRIFEPFFTTKRKDKGTGLGMSIVKRIIERAGGFLHVASEPGKGTSVRLYLPRVSCDA
jgi:signal transduction histidine kinase